MVDIRPFPEEQSAWLVYEPLPQKATHSRRNVRQKAIKILVFAFSSGIVRAMGLIQPTIKGRGTAINSPNRFEKLHVQADPETDAELPPDEQPAAPATVYYRDFSRSVLVANDSPDIGFTHSINPYRGCSHGCMCKQISPGRKDFCSG
jgi:hypothetical protein